jgi:hypothetical protein
MNQLEKGDVLNLALDLLGMMLITELSFHSLRFYYWSLQISLFSCSITPKHFIHLKSYFSPAKVTS